MYTLIDVGVLPGFQTSEATGINRRGEVVGYCSGDSQLGVPRRAFRWKEGVMRDLGTLGGDSVAMDINNRGEVVGYSDNNGQVQPFIWRENSGIQQLQLFGLSGYRATANSISDEGNVAGSFWDEPQRGTVIEHAYLRYQYGLFGPLPFVNPPFPTPPSWGRDCNSAGVVVGGITDPDSPIPKAFQYNGLTGFQSLDVLGLDAEALAINGSGTIVGRRNAFGFVFTNGSFADLQPLPLGQGTRAYATAINDAGTIAGDSLSASDPLFASSATFWLGGGIPNDLNLAVTNLGDWHLTHAAAINHFGEIVGRGMLHGLPRAFLARVKFIFNPSAPGRNIAIEHYFGGRVSGSVAAGAGGFIITPDGRIIPIGPPTPIFRREAIMNMLREMARNFGFKDPESADLKELSYLIDERFDVDPENSE